ncbi:cbb3-type cytochrome oxidase assembly protein CcoS [Marimonas sp. MJW-29]|uniref:Cbb3-type cytochrome oxidase assembly protein CcoS n=1 Tax=Sulfitobacter sediminis TaxID=3234186 RepID=A0ABV3RQP6_9RHOB
MNVLAILIPVSLGLGGLGLLAFLWSLKNDQYEDLDGAGWRVLLDDDAARPVDQDQRRETDQAG